ncbi:MAG: hypothetical protein AB7G23_10770 [Vicinamibacterales bacterium]
MTRQKEKPVVLAELDGVLARAVRIVVKEDPRDTAITLFESTDRKDIDDLRRSLVLEPPDEWLHCMCIGSPAIYLYEGRGKPVQLTSHHGLTVRCSLWDSDVCIGDVEKWASWFESRGMSDPRDEVRGMLAQKEQQKRNWDRWLAAMPEAIVPLWAEALRLPGEVDVEMLEGALERGLPDEPKRIRALLEWFGSGAGPWSGVPFYEMATEKLLLAYPTRSLVEAFELSSVTSAQTEGAARLFGGWSFRKQRPGGLKEVPNALKTKLWNHVRGTQDPDKRQRAESAFTE